MYHKSRMLQITSALALVAMLLFGGILLPDTAPAALAQTPEPSVAVSGSQLVAAGANITYAFTVVNTTGQVLTDVHVFAPLPADTTYVSGGVFSAADNRVEHTLASLALNATHVFTWVVKVSSSVAAGTVIVGPNIDFDYTIGGALGGFGVGCPQTLVEAPGTLVAVYKNANGTPFDVIGHGFQFANYGNEPLRNFINDLNKTDVFTLFGPGVCKSGATAANCVLSTPAQTWLKATLDDLGFGHCGGMAVSSLRLFTSRPFKGVATGPAQLQPGTVRTGDLTFPAQPVENYIAYHTQVQDVVAGGVLAGSPVEIVQALTQNWNGAAPEGYIAAIFKTNDLTSSDPSHWSDGHGIVAYGIETVSPSESRILLYDNNYPNQRQYITVDMAANTWRYSTSATPGQDPGAYIGSAVSGNLQLHPVSARELPPGQYYPCPFCPSQTVASAQAGASDQISGEIDFRFAGEGAILIVDDEGRKTGVDLVTETFVDEIPGVKIIHYLGGLGKEVPPRIVVPFTEHDNTFYSVFVHGLTHDSPTSGSLAIHGSGFGIGVNDIDLDADEVFEFTVSPDGDHISFTASETMVAPEIFIAHDPVHDGDPSVLFDVEGVTVHAGEKISLDLDPVLERIHFADTGAQDEMFVIDMRLVWPDGDEKDYAETIHVPAGATSAFIDFGAWDGLLHPPTYISDTLQNPSVNHRLMLQRASGVYDATPQANAPAGVYHVDATFVNVTEIQLTDLYFTVADLAAGNVLLNADGSPAGAGAKLLVPNTALGDDGLLHVNESVTVRFSIGLTSADTSAVTINANGTPHDWTHEAPALAGEANNASFVFPVRADNPLYLPLVAR